MGPDQTVVLSYFTAPTRTYRYTYDTTGLRASKSLDDEGVTGQGWTKEFTWDTSGGLPLLLAEHRGSQTSYVVYGPQGTPIYQVTGTGDVMYFHQDHLSSIRLVTNANGTTKGTLTYDAYGKPKTNTIGWLQEQPLLGYNSQYHDPETGYIYLRARHYDPTTSQFTTVDPLVAKTEEPYGYSAGDPLNGFDPWGLDDEDRSRALCIAGGGQWIAGQCVNLRLPIPGSQPQPQAPRAPGTPGPGLEPSGFLPPQDEAPSQGSTPMDLDAWLHLGDALGAGATPSYGGCAVGAVFLCPLGSVLEAIGNTTSTASAMRVCFRDGLGIKCTKASAGAAFDWIPVVPGHKFLDSFAKDLLDWCT